ncbi:tRNA dihydrouridine(20/20a) synthase DusA [Methyloglobulus sp.]|uniref:tRNA dihydrouridine(20/20a) synthase DusA n=1 Tax=Methyloglobulus sp. TaxID=2518622 RepID=UPI0032B753A2
MNYPSNIHENSGITSHRFCVAPMMDWTDRHCRFFHRLISQHALLYTEMVTTGALIHGDHHRFLQFNNEEHPLAFQLGGSNPPELALCAKMVEDYGYDEVNLNVGCPSDRVQNGRFGACLMLEPELVADCVAAMCAVVSIPVTVKSRIGVDDRDSYEELALFTEKVASAGCKTFIIHARKALLKGLSPKQNREIPPLKYDEVYQLKAEFPQLDIILNGGVINLDQTESLLQRLDGVMVGREAYQNPYLLADVDNRIFNTSVRSKSRHEIMVLLMPYIEEQLAQGVRLNSITRHVLGLFHGQPGARWWRRHLSENATGANAGINVVRDALAFTVH